MFSQQYGIMIDCDAPRVQCSGEDVRHGQFAGGSSGGIAVATVADCWACWRRQLRGHEALLRGPRLRLRDTKDLAERYHRGAAR